MIIVYRGIILILITSEVKPTETYKEVIPEINNEQASWCRKVDWKIS